MRTLALSASLILSLAGLAAAKAVSGAPANAPRATPTAVPSLASLRSCDIYRGTPYYEYCVRALRASNDIIRQCNELPADHPNGCRRLALGADIIAQCSQLPADHPRGCRALLSMDVIRQCNELPADHPNGCRRLLSDASLICGADPQLSICKRGQTLLSEAGTLRSSSLLEESSLRTSSLLSDEPAGAMGQLKARAEETQLRASAVLSFDGEAH